MDLFETLADEAAAETDIWNRARVLYLPLVDSTQRLVDFNDKYDAAGEAFSVEPLAEDLSRLGENLAARFELEDALIQLLRELEA